jgi:hypothetical protein
MAVVIVATLKGGHYAVHAMQHYKHGSSLSAAHRILGKPMHAMQHRIQTSFLLFCIS